VPRYVAFLRAINVGGHVVKMERLRSLFEQLKLGDAETFIASGNVIFSSRSADAAALERKIERHLQKELGYEVKTFIRSTTEVVRIAAAIEPPQSGTTLFIGFLQQPPSAEAAQKLISASTTADEFRVQERELYWLRRGSSADSEFSGGKIEKLLGLSTTIRNANTVRRIAAKFADDAA
jgi:uncharacterized protein (DUF1697 family)